MKSPISLFRHTVFCVFAFCATSVSAQDLAINRTNVYDDVTSGTGIGNISVLNVTLNEDVTFALLDDAGGRFVLDGNQLQYDGAPSLQSGTSYTVNVRATDSNMVMVDQMFSIDVTDDRFRFLESFADGQGGVDGLEQATGAAVSPDGNHVYAVGLADSAVAVFSRNAAASGSLSFVEAVSDTTPGFDGLNGSRAVAVSGDGDNVYVAAFNESAITTLKRNQGDGTLTFVDTIKEDMAHGFLNGTVDVVVSPDGDFVYTASYNDHAIGAFARDAGMDGELTLVDSYIDGVSGIDGLFNVRSLAVSPDGANLYSMSFTGDLTTFVRNTSTGELQQTQVLENTGPVLNMMLMDGSSVIVSPDGRHVYAMGTEENAIAVLDRDAGSNGELTLKETYTTSTHPEFSGIGGPAGGAFASNGTELVVAGEFVDSVQVLERNPISGLLRAGAVLTNGIDGVTGLDKPREVVISPDDQNFYVPSFTTNSLAVLESGAYPIYNSAPNAISDTIRPLTHDAVSIDVLANDEDTEGVLFLVDFDTMSANGNAITRDTNGTPDDTSDDKLTFTFPGGLLGTQDSFSYTVSDGFLEDEARVYINFQSPTDSWVAF